MVVALLVVLVAVGGIADALNGGSKPSSSATNLPEPTTTETNGTPEASGFSGEGCTSGPAESSVRVTIYGGETCAEWDKTQSSSGTFWRETSPLPYSENAELVCSMEGPGGQTLIEVRDTGEHSYGNRICALLTSEGWRKTDGPGEKLEQSRKAHEANVSAEAEQHREHEAQQQKEAEKPKLEAAASKLKAEAASWRQKQQREEGVKNHDESEAKRLSNDASGAEAEASDRLNEQSDNYNGDADTAQGNIDTDKSEAESKESEAGEDSKKAEG